MNWPETRLFPVDLTMANIDNGTELQFYNEASLWNHVCLCLFTKLLNKTKNKGLKIIIWIDFEVLP